MAGNDIIEVDFSDGGVNESVPRIPEEWRGADIVGCRTSSKGKTSLVLGPIQPRSKLKQQWKALTNVEKYILVLISEHRHLTPNQLISLVVTPSKIRKTKGATFNPLRTYFRWLVDEKYKCTIDYKETFKTTSERGLAQKLQKLEEDGMIEKIVPSYQVKKSDSKGFAHNPSLYSEHYYLTVLGAKVLVCNTNINTNKATKNPVGFVPSYRDAAFTSIVHESECADILCSIISNAEYASNMPSELEDAGQYGIFDVCRFFHEKDCEEKDVVKPSGGKIDFKTDGKLTMFVSSIGDFIDWYLEYDSGSSTKDKIEHKIEAFISYIFWKRSTIGPGFRRPVLLMVTQKPGDFMPRLVGHKTSPYTTAIKNMANEKFPAYIDSLNDIAIVAVADCSSIRQHGAMGACWHVIDLSTGQPNDKAVDIIEASRGVCC